MLEKVIDVLFGVQIWNFLARRTGISSFTMMISMDILSSWMIEIMYSPPCGGLMVHAGSSAYDTWSCQESNEVGYGSSLRIDEC